MRQYLVATWTQDEGFSCETDYREFDELDDAKEFADRSAEQCRKDGLEFDVVIFERTNY